MSLKLMSDILRAANGEVVQLPYNEEQRQLTQNLEKAGLIKSTYDNDCPTSHITEQGKSLLLGKKVIPE